MTSPPMDSANSTAKTPLRITIVFDNNLAVRGFETALGFACVIQGVEKTILFDTGSDGRMLLANMKKLGFLPEDIDIIVLSHNHWDHTGGLAAVLQRNSQVAVFLPADFPPDFKNNVAESGASIVEVTKKRLICRGVWSTGVLGNVISEQSLVCESPHGIVVVTGCAHPGIVKIVEVAKNIRPDIFLVMGGFHLGSTSLGELREIGERFRAVNVRKVAPTHCSGDDVRSLFKEMFAEDMSLVGVGSEILIPA